MEDCAKLPSWLSSRGSGVLLHPSSLPGAYGIGNFGEYARKWIDFLSEAGFTYWQTCPLGPTGFGDSPYQVFSSSAGNPYFIDWSSLVSVGYLTEEDLNPLTRLSDSQINFGSLYAVFFPILKKAYEVFQQRPDDIEDIYGSLSDFKNNNKHWLHSYASYQSIKQRNDLKPWWLWSEDDQDPENANHFSISDSHEYNFHVFAQYLFRSQWLLIKKYASAQDISIIGDLPIYVAPDSADVWFNRQLFQFSENGSFKAVAGVPPDYFNEMGQLWGNPLYNWDLMDQTDYGWWKERIQDQLELFDIIRIDHFRAFQDFWAVPSSCNDARGGTWELGPGLKFWNFMKECFPELPFLAEDLGDITDEVRSLRIAAGLPGMAVLQFAFDGSPENLYLPHNLQHDLVLYTGTHDNDTTLGWYHASDEDARSSFRCYLNVDGSSPSWDMLRLAYRSVSPLVIVPAQDLLSLGSEARFNTPGEPAGNWSWRMTVKQLDQLRRESSAYLRSQAELTGRLRAPDTLLSR
jgi:4-alpha-glucanotransferase